MNSRILLFPAPRTPVFRRSGPVRVMAFLLLLLFSAGLLALLMGFQSGTRRSGGGSASQDPMTLGH